MGSRQWVPAVRFLVSFTSVSTQAIVRLADEPGIGPSETERLGNELGASMVAVLRDLSDDEWTRVTRCAPWTVKDVVAHLVGWGEALTSMKEMRSQVARALKRSKEFGNPTDAQNNIQVEDRAHLGGTELTDRLEMLVPKESIVRRRFGTALRYLPLYSSYLGGLFMAGYLFNVIFLRDMLIHRLDICEATDRDPDIGNADERVIADMLKDWARRRNANVQIEANRWMYVAGPGTNTIAAPVHHVIDALSGRRDPGTLEISGDRSRVEEWIRQGVPI